MTERTARRKATNRPSLLARAAAALLSLAILPGCAQIPTSSQVYSEDISVQDSSPIYYAATGPKEGANPRDIVNGFISAQVAGLSDKWDVAREFLTPEAATKWDPTTDVSVYSGDLSVAYNGESTTDNAQSDPDLEGLELANIVTSAKSLGTVDSTGIFTESLADATYDANFELVRNADGEWRIAALRNGLIFSHSMFESNYRAVSLYFLSPGNEFLVPDVRWFSRVHAETYAMQAFIAGPSKWLRDSVRTATPDGTRFISIAIENGNAVVNLSREVMNTDGAERGQFATQITATLTRIPGIRSVDVKAEQLDVPMDLDSSIVRDPSRAVGPAMNPHVLHKDTVSILQGHDLIPAAKIGSLQGYDVTALAIPENPTLGVFRDGASQLRQVPSNPEPAPSTEGNTAGTEDSENSEDTAQGRAETVVLLQGDELITPSIDIFRWIWSGERAQSTEEGMLRLASYDTDKNFDLAVPWLAGRDLNMVRVSPDGTRLAVVSSLNGVVHVEVAGIVRDATGVPLSLGDPVTVGGQIVDANAVSWLDESTLWIVGNSDTSDLETLFSANISGPSVVVAPAEGTNSISSARGTRGVILGTDGGLVRTRGSSGASWSDVAQDAWFPNFPG